MKNLYLLISFLFFLSCEPILDSNKVNFIKADLTNKEVKEYNFLDCMYHDVYFPDFLVFKCENILVELCWKIENTSPKSLQELYKLTHEATDKINNLESEFIANDSEIETIARECLGRDFEAISNYYGYNADIEELIGTRTW